MQRLIIDGILSLQSLRVQSPGLRYLLSPSSILQRFEVRDIVPFSWLRVGLWRCIFHSLVPSHELGVEVRG